MTYANVRLGSEADIPCGGRSIGTIGGQVPTLISLTSHGSLGGLAVSAGRRSNVISPRKLRKILEASRARYRIVITSACYSGVFVPVLANPNTLVISAAAADRPSFGCEDGATWTYFGDAFYNQALRRHARLDAAFVEAKRLVTEREPREGFEPSKPQIAGGATGATALDG